MTVHAPPLQAVQQSMRPTTPPAQPSERALRMHDALARGWLWLSGLAVVLAITWVTGLLLLG
jgi:hypothetical protein